MIQYPLPEKIGDPELLVGREKEFGLLNKWLDRIPKRLSKSRGFWHAAKAGKLPLSSASSIVCGALMVTLFRFISMLRKRKPGTRFLRSNITAPLLPNISPFWKETRIWCKIRFRWK